MQRHDPVQRPHSDNATVPTISFFFSGPESNIGTHVALSFPVLNLFRSGETPWPFPIFHVLDSQTSNHQH